VPVCKTCALAFLDTEPHSCQIPRRSIFSVMSLLFPTVALVSFLTVSRLFDQRGLDFLFFQIALASELLGFAFLIVACLRSERWWSLGVLGIMVPAVLSIGC
jgi:hypothetical protein